MQFGVCCTLECGVLAWVGPMVLACVAKALTAVTAQAGVALPKAAKRSESAHAGLAKNVAANKAPAKGHADKGTVAKKEVAKVATAKETTATEIVATWGWLDMLAIVVLVVPVVLSVAVCRKVGTALNLAGGPMIPDAEVWSRLLQDSTSESCRRQPQRRSQVEGLEGGGRLENVAQLLSVLTPLSCLGVHPCTHE